MGLELVTRLLVRDATLTQLLRAYINSAATCYEMDLLEKGGLLAHTDVHALAAQLGGSPARLNHA